jgi:hypothetical protein
LASSLFVNVETKRSISVVALPNAQMLNATDVDTTRPPPKSGRKSAGSHGIAWEILEFNGRTVHLCAFPQTSTDQCCRKTHLARMGSGGAHPNGCTERAAPFSALPERPFKLGRGRSLRWGRYGRIAPDSAQRPWLTRVVNRPPRQSPTPRPAGSPLGVPAGATESDAAMHRARWRRHGACTHNARQGLHLQASPGLHR